MEKSPVLVAPSLALTLQQEPPWSERYSSPPEMFTKDIIHIPDRKASRKRQDAHDHVSGDHGSGGVGGARGQPTEEEDVAKDTREEDEGEGDLVIDGVGEADAVAEKRQAGSGGSRRQRDPSDWFSDSDENDIRRGNDTSPRATIIRAMYHSPMRLCGTLRIPTTGQPRMSCEVCREGGNELEGTAEDGFRPHSSLTRTA